MSQRSNPSVTFSNESTGYDTPGSLESRLIFLGTLAIIRLFLKQRFSTPLFGFARPIPSWLRCCGARILTYRMYVAVLRSSRPALK